jgi:hypothetical protein
MGNGAATSMRKAALHIPDRWPRPSCASCAVRCVFVLLDSPTSSW